ncbi:MAG: hypothetical protein FWD76_05915 [Firmicutes bacterium]|nr:hypothetical protein [Bacillota bacterium]
MKKFEHRVSAKAVASRMICDRFFLCNNRDRGESDVLQAKHAVSGYGAFFGGGGKKPLVIACVAVGLALVLGIVLWLALSPGKEAVKYTVSFDSRGGSAVSEVVVESGKTFAALLTQPWRARLLVVGTRTRTWGSNGILPRIR